ncbi:hypothetical protein MAHJHV55_54690 [Mycobacterium avium subsp. hominissuis]
MWTHGGLQATWTSSSAPAVVLIDLPDPIAGAAELGPLIADALRGSARAARRR